MTSTRPEGHSVKVPFSKDRRAWSSLQAVVAHLMAADPMESAADVLIENARRASLGEDIEPEHRAAFQVVTSVLCDLRLQGWSFRVQGKVVLVSRPTAELAPDVERERVRRMHAVNRSIQLLKGSVRSFVRGMEKKQIGPDGWVSIFSLMRDGRELAQKLRLAMSANDQVDSLRSVVCPYLQAVREGEVCEHTGLPLGDIWRYFRYTWVNEYQTVPGRNLLILVRDAAARFHPVIGIAALTSPVVHLTLRDEWIGWAPQRFVAELRERPTTAWARWVHTKLEQLIAGILIDDLVRSDVVSKSEITRPTEDAIARLEEEADFSRKQHYLHPTKSIHKNPAKGARDEEWRFRAETHLFRSKRCATLAELLRAKLRLRHAGFTRPTVNALAKTLSTSEGRRAVETVRKHVKAIHIGNDVLDISVCGAIAPYSELLGGKLVAMLLTSPEVVHNYAQRYGRSFSIIASSMAGRRVNRRPRLTALTTTSLYASELNQYTRIRVPANEVGGPPGRQVAFQKLGQTRGQGSFHFSAVTVDLIEVLLGQMSDSRSVNSIFGEGVSPRLRKIRAGLDACGFPSDEVLTHGSPRIVYGVALAANQRDYLLERAKQPTYLLPQRRASEDDQPHRRLLAATMVISSCAAIGRSRPRRTAHASIASSARCEGAAAPSIRRGAVIFSSGSLRGRRLRSHSTRIQSASGRPAITPNAR